MSLAMHTWLSSARLRWRRARAPNLRDNRRQLIRRLAPGKSVLDLGGMYGIHGEVAFLAEEARAAHVTLFDGMDPTAEFQAEHKRRDSSVRYVQGDLHDAEIIEELGTFDIVWCAGVIYHSPNPHLLLEHLRHLVGEQLLVGTHIIPEVPGFEQVCIFYPGTSAAARGAFARAHGKQAPALVGMATPFDATPLLGYVNFWWGITPSALRAMLTTAGFDLVEEFTYSPFFVDALARPSSRESVVPPAAFSRERGAARLADYPEDARPKWA